MKISNSKDFIWKFNKEENVFVGINPDLCSKELGIYHIRIKPKEELRKHYHERPNNGKEIFFFYKGGHFLLEINGKTYEHNSTEPLYLCLESGEIHGIKNLSNDVLEFQAVYCPDFEEGEVRGEIVNRKN